jgi:hypothetical protein
MRVLKIDENYSVRMEDNYNYTLDYEEVKELEGKTITSRNTFYYPSLVMCLKKYLNLVHREAKDVKDCIRITEECYDKLSKLKFE